MQGSPPGFLRSLAHDVGGVPAWLLFGLSTVAAVAVVVLGTLSAGARPIDPYAPPAGAVTPSIPPPMPMAAFLGDSYTQGAGGGNVTWPSLVGEARGWDVVNLGLGGTGYVTTSGPAGCGRPQCGTFAEASTEILGDPRFIFITGGRNDLRTPTAKIAAAASALFTDLVARYPSAQIFVINPWFDDDPAPASLTALTKQIGAAAADAGITFLDTKQPLEAEPDLIAPDGIHPNADGYRVLAAAVESALSAALAD